MNGLPGFYESIFLLLVFTVPLVLLGVLVYVVVRIVKSEAGAPDKSLPAQSGIRHKKSGDRSSTI